MQSFSGMFGDCGAPKGADEGIEEVFRILFNGIIERISQLAKEGFDFTIVDGETRDMDSLGREVRGIQEVSPIRDVRSKFFVGSFDFRWPLHRIGGHGRGVRFGKFQDSALGRHC